VLVGHALLDRPVRWVHPTDLMNPTQYLRAGDLVLTNGVWRRRPADSMRFVRALARAGAAALGFGLRTASSTTPADLIEVCDRHGLPLIQVPHDMPFSAFSEAVAGYFADERQSGLIRALRRDQAMLSSLAQGTGLAGVISMLARDYQLRIGLLTHGGQVLAGTTPSGKADESAAIWRAAAGIRRPAAIEIDGTELSAFPIMLHGQLQACLVCWKPLRDLTEEERAAIEQELAFIGVELAHARTRREIQQHFAAELLDLIDAGEAKVTEVARRLKSLGVDPGLPMTALVIQPKDTSEITVGGLAEGAELFFASRGHAATAPQADGRVVVIASAGSDREVMELANGLSREFAQEGWDARIGVGGVCHTGVLNIQRSLIQAEHALELAIQGDSVMAVTTFTAVGSYSMLFAMQDAQYKRSFVSALLGVLIDHDRGHRTQLVHSLDVYLSAGANWQRAANRLHIHVNTLRYRVSQIERLTGRDLSSMDDRVSFYIALRGAAMLEASGPAAPAGTFRRGRSTSKP
jgi:purine catabolism regulator